MQAHHALFQVFGGENAGNLMWIDGPVHAAFHSFANAMLEAAGLPRIDLKYDGWWDATIKQPGAREAVKQVLLEAAETFDHSCSKFTRGYGPGRIKIREEVKMKDLLEQYFKDVGW